MGNRGRRQKGLLISVCLLFAFVTIVSALNTGSRSKIQLKESFVQSPEVYAAAEPTGKAPNGELSKEDKLVAQSSKTQLYLNKKTGVMKLLDQSNGYIWSSSSQNSDLSGMNKSWKSYAKSLLAVDYVNADGKVKTLSTNTADSVEYTKTSNGFTMTAKFDDVNITVGAEVALDNDTLTVKVPQGVIQDNDENQVSMVTVLPFFGAVREDTIPGYSFISDGCGALIRFEKERNYTSPYTATIYGDDQGLTRKQPDPAVEVKRAAVSVFGMAHGGRQNAFLAVAESGAEYGKIESYPAGVVTPFNWTCFSFTYKNQYFQKTDRENGGYSTYSKNRNAFDICVSYSFLHNENASYTGMAVKYRHMLQSKGQLGKAEAKSGVPLHIEAVMAEVGPSVLGTSVIPMTTVKDVQKWQEQLSGDGIGRLTVTLSGWEKGGLNGHKLSQNEPDSQTGKKSEYNTLVKQVEQAGGTVYFTKNTMSGYEDQLNMNRNGIVNIDGTVASLTDPTAPLLKTLYYNNSKTVTSLSQSIDTNSFLKDKFIAFDAVSSKLYSDYSKNAAVTREAARTEVQKALSIIPANRQALYDPNMYACPYANAVFDIPVTGSGYLYALEYVPFIQTVLSGSAEMYSPYCNFVVNSRSDVLRLIDFGEYPSFVLTQKPSYLFAKTNLNNVFSSAFDDWKDKITETYNEINPVLSKVTGKSIVDRKTPQNGVSVVTYEGNIRIYVNYNDSAVTINNQVLAPLSAAAVNG